jgi:phosphatidylglycerol:prolipoprotein diacylglycerol transferase
MHKILLSEPRIGSYSAFLLLALFSGYLLARWRAVRSGIKGAHVDNLILIICVSSLFGARLFSWIFYFPPGASFFEALRNPSGGMVFYGGMVFGALALLLYGYGAKLPIPNLLDVFSPALALGLAIGRIGCFMAGCCWGDLCIEPQQLGNVSSSAVPRQIQTFPIVSGPRFPLSVQFPVGSGAYEQHRELGLITDSATRSLPVHPVQIYESLLAFALCLFLHYTFPNRRFHGQIACLLLLNYGLIRFTTEFFRADNAAVNFGLSLSQLISVLFAVIGFGILNVASRHNLQVPAEALSARQALNDPRIPDSQDFIAAYTNERPMDQNHH